MRTYLIKYRQPGQIFWRKLRKTVGDGITDKFRYFHCEDDSIIYVSLDAEVYFSPDRQKVIEKKMSSESGLPIQRAE